MAPRRASTPYVPHADGERRRLGGASLFEHLMGVYALGKPMSAKDLAIACHFASEAGTPGAHWSIWGLGPGRQTGKYKQHIDELLPDPGPMYAATIPMAVRGKAHEKKGVQIMQK
eukprot:6808188-Pyramimonas_sp.AAC.1